MSKQYVSVVQIIKEEHKDTLNNFAASLGYGDNSLSVKLINKNGEIFYGCHSWWEQTKYFTFKNKLFTIIPPSQYLAIKPVLNLIIDNAIFSLNIDNFDSYSDNWLVTLEKYGLKRVEEDNV